MNMPHYNNSSHGADRSKSHPGSGNRRKKPGTAKTIGGNVASLAVSSEVTQDDSSEASRQHLQLQQRLLDVFARSFPELLNATASDSNSKLSSVLAQVKRHLYERDFVAAFGSEENLAAYAVRWSPSRALGYVSIFEVFVRRFFDSSSLE